MFKERVISLTEEAYGLKGGAFAVSQKFAKIRNGEYMTQQDFKALMDERGDLLHRVCIFINQINNRLNLAASNPFERLPISEYKDHVEARRIARAVKAELENLIHRDE